MAAKTFYWKDAVPSGATKYRSLQDGGSAPTTASTTTGWVANQKAIGQSCLQQGGTIVARTAGTWGTTLMPNAAPVDGSSLGDAWRSENTISGDFANSNWVFTFGVRSTVAYAGRLKLAVRVWRSVNADGSSAVELTSGRVVSAATGANLSTSADTTITCTWSPGATKTLTAEYLFVNVGIEVTAAGSANTQDMFFRVGSAYTVVTPNFTQTVNGAVAFAGAGSTSLAGNELKPGSVPFAGVGALAVTGNTTPQRGAVAFAGNSLFYVAGFEPASARQIPGASMYVLAFTGQAQIPGSAYVDALVYDFASGQWSGSGSTSFVGSTGGGSVANGAVAYAGVGSVSFVAAELAASHLSASGAGTFAPVGHENAASHLTASGAGTFAPVGHENAASQLTTSGAGAFSPKAGAHVAFAGSGSASIIGHENAASHLTASGAGAFAPHAGAHIGFAGAGSFAPASGGNAQGSVPFAGIGSLSAVGHMLANGVVAFHGVGSTSFVAHENAAAHANFAGTGSTSFVAHENEAGLVAFAGAGSVTVRGGAHTAFAGSGALSAIGHENAASHLTAAGAGSFAPHAGARVGFAGSGAFAGAAAALAQASWTGAGVGSFAPLSGASASGAIAFAGVGAFTGTAAALASATLAASGVGAFAPVGQEFATASLNAQGAGAFDAVGSETADAVLNASGAGTFDVHGATAAQGQGVVPFAGSGALAAAGAAHADGVLTASGAGSTDFEGAGFAEGFAAFAGNGAFAADGEALAIGVADFAGAGSFDAQTAETSAGAAQFAGMGEVTPAGAALADGAIAFAGEGVFDAEGASQASAGAVAFVGSATFEAESAPTAAIGSGGLSRYLMASPRTRASVAAGAVAFAGGAAFAPDGAAPQQRESLSRLVPLDPKPLIKRDYELEEFRALLAVAAVTFAEPLSISNDIDHISKGIRAKARDFTKRKAIRVARAKLRRSVAAFLQSQVPDIAAQIHALMRAHGYAKAEMSDDELLALDDIIARIEFNQWVALVGQIDNTLSAIAEEGAYAALAQVGIDVTADKAVANVVNEFALDYGKTRSAEMVGMRLNAAGELVQNPNAIWQITEGTRDGIRATVEEAMREGWSNDKIAASLQDAYAFSDERAMMIARTESQMAANRGALEGYKASGVVQGKEWITAEDDLVSEECQENADAGEIALDADFPSGDDAPPVHPNCRCSIVPVVMQTQDEEQAIERATFTFTK